MFFQEVEVQNQHEIQAAFFSLGGLFATGGIIKSVEIIILYSHFQ